LVEQRRDEDCAVTAIAHFFALRYEDVFVAAVRANPTWKRDGGLNIDQMIATARLLGRRLKRVNWRRVDLEESTGILVVNWNRPKEHHGSSGHWVVLREGHILDAAPPALHDADEFLRQYNGRVGTLLVER
jgi:ABC-type bacteriocin/lantibiotic exporter with double-glycine peptidase domain